MALFYIYSKIRREEFEVPNSRPLRIHSHFNKHRIEATVELMNYTLGETYFFRIEEYVRYDTNIYNFLSLKTFNLNGMVERIEQS